MTLLKRERTGRINEREITTASGLTGMPGMGVPVGYDLSHVTDPWKGA